MEKLDLDKISELMKIKGAALKGYKAGYTAAVLDIQNKLRKHVFSTLKENAESGIRNFNKELVERNVMAELRKIDLGHLKDEALERIQKMNLGQIENEALAGIRKMNLGQIENNALEEIQKMDIDEIEGGMPAGIQKMDLDQIKNDVMAGIQKLHVEELWDTAEAGVLKKMEELRQVELSERDKKIAILAAASVVCLIVCTVFYVRKHKKKREIVKMKAGKKYKCRENAAGTESTDEPVGTEDDKE